MLRNLQLIVLSLRNFYRLISIIFLPSFDLSIEFSYAIDTIAQTYPDTPPMSPPIRLVARK